ncbi:MAG TPA: hypothetical protein PKE40_00655 [Arachnia sp.]|nr:hypothetical protein [Arachnia sp.]HMT84836.1 hypothetical protein [Arachnia sp.]
MCIRTGGKRYASYRLIDDIDQLLLSRREEIVSSPERAGIEADLDAIIQAIQAGHTTSRSLVEHLGMGYQSVVRRLRELEDRGLVVPTRPERSSKQSYRIVGN